MAEFIVTRKNDGVEVLRYSAAEAMPVNGFDFAYYEHTAFDPETLVAQVDASLWKIYVGAFFDRFGAAKIAILASDDLLVQAIIKDASVRHYIDLRARREELLIALNMLLSRGFPIDPEAILDNPPTDAEVWRGE